MQPTLRRVLFALMLLAGLSWIFLRGDTATGPKTAGGIPAPRRGFLAPDFSLATPSGEKIQLSALKGRAVVLNIWTTWCPPCRAEMPAMEEYYRQYKDQGLIILGVNSTIQDNPLDVVPFVNAYGLTFPILLDETGEMGSKYDLRSLPSSYFINRDGTIAEIVIGGPMSEALLQTNIRGILNSASN
jgi:cytochrome c biogenesis protein CcmG/thiol:disulfide interchange protein DsbE